MSLVPTTAQQQWVQSRSARRVFSVELPYHDGLPAQHLATEPLVLDDPFHWFEVGPGSEPGVDAVHAVTFRPAIADETTVRQGMDSHIWGSSEVERGVIEVPVEGSAASGWDLARWAGREAVLRWGDSRWSRVVASGTDEAHITVVTAIVTGYRHQGERIIIEMQPQIRLFDVLFNDRFKAEAQGVIPAAPEIAGEFVPYLLGQVNHAPALLYDSAELKYWRAGLVSDTVNVEARDNNVELVEGTDYTVSFETMDLDNAIGKITWSGEQHNFYGDIDGTEITRVMRLAFGVAGEDNLFELGSLTANATLDDAMAGDTINVGVYIDSERPFVNALQTLADAAGLAWFVGVWMDSTAIERYDKAIFRRVEPPNGESITLLSRTRTDVTADTLEQAEQRAYIDSSGALQSAAADTLRHDYHPETGEWRGILMEGAQKNWLYNSHDPFSYSANIDAGVYTLSVLGSGQVSIGANAGYEATATQGNPAVFRVYSDSLLDVGGGSTADAYLLQDAEHVGSILETGTDPADLTAPTDRLPVTELDAITGECTVVVEWEPLPRHDLIDVTDAQPDPELATSDAGPLTVAGVRTETVVRLTDGAESASESIDIGELDGQARARVVDGGTTQADLTGGTVGNDTITRVAVRVAANDLMLAVNGAQVDNDTNASLPDIQRLIVGEGCNVWLRTLAVYPGTLDDAQLAAASVLGADLRRFDALGTPAYEFGPHNIAGGVDIERATEPVQSVAVSRRTSWADTGGDVVDPALSPADKRELQQQRVTKVYSPDAAVTDAPAERETIHLEVVDEASQDVEGLRLARIFQRERQFYRFRALVGALQIQPGDIVRVWHDAEATIGRRTDSSGQPLTDRAGIEVRGRNAFIVSTEQQFPSGQVQVEAWA